MGDMNAEEYAERREEIDAWIRRVDEEADQLETAWRLAPSGGFR